MGESVMHGSGDRAPGCLRDVRLMGMFLACGEARWASLTGGMLVPPIRHARYLLRGSPSIGTLEPAEAQECAEALAEDEVGVAEHLPAGVLIEVREQQADIAQMG